MLDGGAALAQTVHLADGNGLDWAGQLTAWATLASAVFLGLSALILGLTAYFVGNQAKIAVEQQRDAIEQRRDAKRTRHAELIVNLSRRWDEIMRSMQLFSAYRKERLVELVRELYGGRRREPREPASLLMRLRRYARHRLRGAQRVDEGPINDFITLIELPALIEAIGVLERDGGLGLNVIDALWGSTIVSAWATWKDAVLEMRDLTETRTTFENFERLAERLAAADARPQAEVDLPAEAVAASKE